MTPVRPKRSTLMHATRDATRTLCNRPCSAWIVGTADPRQDPDCITCQRCRGRL